MLALPAMPAAAAADAGGSRASYSVEPGLEYVAIASSGMARQLGPLIEWKADRGMPAQIFTLEAILAQYGGRDDAERLQNFLQDLYYNVTGGTVRWLLLAGDSDVVPVRYLWADRDHSGKRTASINLYLGDMYFSCLGSDWDADGDSVFGEPGEEDPTPELYVGRIAASTPAELEAAVRKTLAYELDPPLGDWFRNVFLAGALMDEPNLLDDPYTLPRTGSGTDEGYDPNMDNAWEVTQDVRRILGEGWDYVDLADYPMREGGQYTYRVDTLSHQSAASAWFRGNAVAFWASHGYEGFGALAEYSGDGYDGMFECALPFIGAEDLSDPATGGMLPLVYVSSCYVGQFDKEDAKSFEGMITSPEGGAIALIAGDGDTFRLENISTEGFGNWWLSKRFFEMLVGGGIDRPGQLIGELKRQYHEFYMTEGPPAEDATDMDYFYSNLYSYNLQGDPEVPVWLGIPQRLSMEVVRGAVANSSSVVVRVTDAETGTPVEGARVLARGAGLPTGTGTTTGADGVAGITPGPTELGGELRLAATKKGCVPARLVLAVGLGARDLTILPEDVSGPRYFQDLGEVARYEVTVHNTGDFSASTVPVRFDSGDASAPDTGADARVQTRLVDLAPGARVTLDFSHRYTTTGNFGVSFTVDPQDVYAEADEGDNKVVVQLTHKPLPTVPGQVGPFQLQAGSVHDAPIDLDAYVTSPPGFPRDIRFEVVGTGPGISAWVDPGDRLQLLPSADGKGATSVTVALVVDGARAGEMQVLLEVGSANRAPVVSAPARAVLGPGEPLLLQVDASDPDGEDVRITTDLPRATVEGHTIRWSPLPGDAGRRVVTVTAQDASGASATAVLELVVARENNAPAFTEDGPVELHAEGDELIEFALPAVDPDSDPLTYAIDVLSTGFRVDAATGLLEFDPTGLEAGTYDVTVVVSDGRATAFKVVSIEVERPSGAPVVALIAAGFVLLAGAGAAVVFRRR